VAYIQAKSVSIHHEDGMLTDILKIDMEKKNMLHDLTIAQASQKYNQLGGKTFCRCKHDCVLSKKQFSCIALGILGRDKCHGTREDVIQYIAVTAPCQAHYHMLYQQIMKT
jgi:hypothetical protein